jgi:hypothetical protein
MPDEREMAEVHEAMQPQSSSEPSRHERRRIAREQSASDRFTGIKRCDWCEFELELEREAIPERCPGCGRPYDPEGDGSDKFTAEGIYAMSTLSTARRQAAAIELVAGAIELGAEALTGLTTLLGDVAEALSQRVGKTGR